MRLGLNDDMRAKRPLAERVNLRRNVYLLPNFITTGALFFGFYSIMLAFKGEFTQAVISILVAAVFDTADGRIARLTKTVSNFGAQYDSLSDMVAFGVAPAVVLVAWGAPYLGNFGWICGFFYAACCALRLARFNNQDSEQRSKNHFTGLPSTLAGIIIASGIWVVNENSLLADMSSISALMMALLTLCLGLLMVSEISYWNPKKLTLRSTKPFVSLVGFVVFFTLVASDPSKVIFALTLIYAVLGPLSATCSKLIRLLLRLAAFTPPGKAAEKQENQDAQDSFVVNSRRKSS